MKANLNTWKKFHCKQKLEHAANERDIIYACAIAREGLRPSSMCACAYAWAEWAKGLRR